MLRCLPLVLLAGCAVDCASSDWQARGYADGYGGHPPQLMRLKPCAIPEGEYMDGWAKGHDEWDRLIGSRQNSQR
jgi:hypothetical protein